MIDWVSVLLNAAPMLLLIVVWIGFMVMLRRGGWQTKYQTKYLAQMDAQVAALERIAAALEKRAS